jgi:hypothetical protein
LLRQGGQWLYRPLPHWLSLELGSEAPGFCDNYPSDIYFYVNGIEIGCWTSPDDLQSGLVASTFESVRHAEADPHQ